MVPTFDQEVTGELLDQAEEEPTYIYLQYI